MKAKLCKLLVILRSLLYHTEYICTAVAVPEKDGENRLARERGIALISWNEEGGLTQ